jgi:DNA-binding IclR family transcriptional regulator
MWIHSGNNPEPALITRVASEFRERPGLALTVHEAARLFHLAAQACWQVLDQLQRDGVVERTAAGLYRLARE